MANADPGLDHFLFYAIATQPAGDVIGVQTQFDIGPAAGPEKLGLRAAIAFANPVQKNEEKIVDRNSHLTWYAAYDWVPDPIRVVNYTDQFGRRKIHIGRKYAFLSPTQKRFRGSKFPEGLDHYVAFQVLDFSTPAKKAVKLRDQWGSYEATAYGPYFFAAPSRKWHAGETHGVKNAKAHLAIYRLTPKRVDKAAATRDQFGTRFVNASYTQFLAVPASKGKWQKA